MRWMVVAALLAAVARWTVCEGSRLDTAGALALLRDRYGITVTGAFTPLDVDHVLTFARQHRPMETHDLTFQFAKERISSGANLGEWAVDGLAEIRSDRADTVFHEGTHHILEYDRNVRTRPMAALIYDAAKAAGGGKIPDCCYTRRYARYQRFEGDSAEFLAELVTGVAGLERGLPVETTIENRDFNPPESVRRLVRALWAPAAD